MKEVLTELKGLDLRNDSEQRIKEVIQKIRIVCNPAYKLPVGNAIYRSVKVTPDFFPDTKSKVSFNPYAKDFGRANVKGKTVFYGSITTRRTENDLKLLGLNPENALMLQSPGYMINILECSEIAIDPDEEGSELYSVGMWRIFREMEVSTVINRTPVNDFGRDELDYLNKFYDDVENNRNVDGLDKELVEHLRLNLPEFKEVNEIIVNEFGKDVNEKEKFQYQISANYANNIIYSNNNYIQGLKYPSVKANKEGYNVALHPKVVQENFVGLERTALVRIFKKKDSKEIVWNWEGVAEHKEGLVFDFRRTKEYVTDENIIKILKQKNMEHLFVPSMKLKYDFE